MVDVAILGGGPGGYTAAIRAAQHGLKVAVIEAEQLGGVCLNWGCIPTKALLRNAEVLNLVRTGERFGLQVEFSFDYGKAIDRSREVVERLRRGIAFLFRKHRIDLLQGSGKLLDPHRIAVGDREIEADSIILATGSRPRTLPDRSIGERILTSRQILERRTLPRHLMILGGGAIGLEFATTYASYGVEVTLVEQLPHILPREDAETAKLVASLLSKQGIRIKSGAKVEKIEQIEEVEDSVRLRLANGETVEGEVLLLAIGVLPNTENLGLESVGVEMERGFIRIDEKMRTNVPHLYAIGDVTGILPLAHVASAQGVLAADVIAGKPVHPLHYERIPRCTYSFPQVASIGITEEQAKEQGIPYRVGRFPFSANGLAPALEETDGQVKLLVDPRYGSILGGHIVGAEASELVAQIALLMESEGTVDELSMTTYAHPTLSEAVKEAALAAIGMSLNL